MYYMQIEHLKWKVSDVEEVTRALKTLESNCQR